MTAIPDTSAPTARPAEITQPTPLALALSGSWTALGVGAMAPQLDAVRAPSKSQVIADGAHIEALDTAGAWTPQKLLAPLKAEGTIVTLTGLRPGIAALLAAVAQQFAEPSTNTTTAAKAPPTTLESI